MKPSTSYEEAHLSAPLLSQHDEILASHSRDDRRSLISDPSRQAGPGSSTSDRGDTAHDNNVPHELLHPSWIWEKRRQLRDHEFPGWGSVATMSTSALSAKLNSSSMKSLNGSTAESLASEQPGTHIPLQSLIAEGEVHAEIPVEVMLSSELVQPSPAPPKPAANVKLGQLATTAICGNDILSSVLYVCGLVTCSAGKAAPLCLVLVSVVLYLFRWIYGEAITAIPMNGGCYSVLINTTSKPVSAWAAALGVLAYLATGVMSAASACYYLKLIVPESVDVIFSTVALLFAFALLCAFGLSESAFVASIIFLVHVATLTLLCGVCATYAIWNQGGELLDNLATDFPEVTVNRNPITGSIFTAVFFGLCSALLGVSGFETSSQFVQEQAPGVYLKSLRNMWLGVTVFNPVISALSLCVFSVADISHKKETLLADMGGKVGDWMGTLGGVSIGHVLQVWISLDAFVVLSGAVLTAYVGVNGLMKRLAMDRILPQVLLQENWRGTNHIQLFSFFVVASSLVVFLNGETSMLSGVYSLAFLGLMLFLAVGLMMLKFKRPDIPREVHCPWWAVVLGMVMVFLGIVGNVLAQIDALAYFVIYFSTVLGLAFVMLNTTTLLRLFLYVCESTFPNTEFHCLKESIKKNKAHPNIFFAKYPDLCLLNKAILYVRENEQTADLKVVHCLDPTATPEQSREISCRFQEGVALLDSMYPKLRVSLVLIEDDQRTGSDAGTYFNEDVIKLVSETLQTPMNMMFIACPSSCKLDAYGGVRIITH